MANPTYGEESSQGVESGAFVNIIGAIISLAVLAGIVVWGAQTLMRDASGVPVVRVLDDAMRVAPENPGGKVADNQGLAVNEVVSSQPRSTVSEDLRLAPRPASLEEGETAIPASAPVTAPAARGNDSELSAEIEALAAQLAAATQPLTELSTGAEAPAVVTSLGPQPEASSTGLARSLRPQVRPAAFVAHSATPAAAPAAFGAASVAAGTRLAQLGAFNSIEIAEREWKRMVARHSSIFGARTPVVQETQSNGRTLYRLRAQGFDDSAAARRFCSALVDEGVSCFPVVMQ